MPVLSHMTPSRHPPSPHIVRRSETLEEDACSAGSVSTNSIMGGTSAGQTSPRPHAAAACRMAAWVQSPQITIPRVRRPGVVPEGVE
eukprot:15439613-Heterocapsa_arctica.AAC.1